MLNSASNQLFSFYERFQTFYQLESVQNVVGVTHLAFAALAAHHLIRTYYFADRHVQLATLLGWQERTIRIVDILGDVSFILNGLRSRPMLVVWRWAARKVLSSAQIEQHFGHAAALSGQRISFIVGLASLILGIPSSLKILYASYRWIAQRRYEAYFLSISHAVSVLASRIGSISYLLNWTPRLPTTH